jgi:hypothetical protein
MSLLRFLRRPKGSDPAGPSRVVVVGLDFGTSSIKAAVRELTDRSKPVALVDFGTKIDGFSRFAFPSSISIRPEAIRTGVDAEQAGPVGLQRSVKMKLLGQSVGASIWPDWLPRGEGIDLPEPEFAAALLLASALKSVKQAVSDDLEGLSDVRLLINLDVPVDELDQPQSHRRFSRILRIALKLADTLQFPCPRNRAIEAWLVAAMEVSQDGTPEAERPWSVVGEAQAILGGIADSIQPEPTRPYVIVDIGAGTTDVGVFRLSTVDGEDRVNFFAAGPCYIGCDQIDEHLCEGAFGSVRGDALASVRAAKRQLAQGKHVDFQTENGTVTLTPDHLRGAIDAISGELVDHYIDRWNAALPRGHRRRRNMYDWEQAGLVVVGGGSLIPALCELYSDPPKGGDFLKSVLLLTLSERSETRVIGRSSTPAELADLQLMVAARGLSHGLPHLKRLVTPQEIDDDFDDGEEGPYSGDRDDYYPA